MAIAETFDIEGHIVDSLILAKVLDLILDAGADYRIEHVEIGKRPSDTSRARIEVVAPDEATLEGLYESLAVQGANPVDVVDAGTRPAPADGVFSDDFHATTNLATDVRIGGRWVPVENPEMDCGIVIGDRVRTVPMHRVRAGDAVVVGAHGVRVHAPRKPAGVSMFEFMDSEVSPEKHKTSQVLAVADRMRAAHAEGRRILAVCGPAVVHTGGNVDLARLVGAGWIDVLFAGNGFATHDIESATLGTSLGVSTDQGAPVHEGHSNHLRVLNTVRRFGSITKAIDAGWLRAGVMYECVRRGVPFVLAGSLRDDGPLPEVIPDMLEAADLMRREIDGVGVALMFASTLHAIATGNLLPASVETFCVDINHSVVTKLADRGSHQARGIVTDVGLFLRALATELC